MEGCAALAFLAGVTWAALGPAALFQHSSPLARLFNRVTLALKPGRQGSMVKYVRVGLRCDALRKECLADVRQWPGCETIGGIQIIRSNKPGGFPVRITLYGKAE